MRNEDQLQAAAKHEWLELKEQPLNPLWNFHTWSAEEQKSVRSQREGLTHEQIMNILATLRRTIPENAVLTGFHATRPLTEKLEGPVLPFLMSVGMRSEHADQAYHAMSTPVDSAAALKVVGIRWRQERLDRQPLVKALENLPRVFAMRLEPERQRQLQQAGPRFQHEGAQPALTCDLDRVRKPEYRLRNPHNVCYLNSSVIALAWAGVVTDKPAAYGALGAALLAVNSARGVYVPRSLSWMSVLQHWPNLHRQQDAGEFLTFLLGRANPPPYAGFWQARRTEHGQTQVLDGGTLSAPLAMPLHGQALQDCIDAWESQPSIHAAVASGGLIIIQLMRYQAAGCSKG